MNDRQQNQCDSIVDAATRVLYRDGYAKMTIDSIAAEANMTKGGVFYYFKNKSDIVARIVEHYEETYNARRRELHDKLPKNEPGRFLRATVTASLEYYDENKDNIQNLVGLYTDDLFKETLRSLKKRIFDQLAGECKHPEKVAMILFALDGMWMDRTLGESSIPHKCLLDFRKQLLDYVEQVARECL